MTKPNTTKPIIVGRCYVCSQYAYSDEPLRWNKSSKYSDPNWDKLAHTVCLVRQAITGKVRPINVLQWMEFEKGEGE